MKYINLILILLTFCSCSTNKSTIGLYGECKQNYLACTQIELKNDKTFEYFIFMDVGGGNVIEGNWEQISVDSIKLNTFEQPKNQSTRYNVKTNLAQTDNIKITIKDWELPLAGVFVVLNNQDTGKVADINGSVEFTNQEIKTITYYYLGQKESIDIDSTNFNEIEVTIRNLDLGTSPKFLTNEIIILRNNKLFSTMDFYCKKLI